MIWNQFTWERNNKSKKYDPFLMDFYVIDLFFANGGIKYSLYTTIIVLWECRCELPSFLIRGKSCIEKGTRD